MPRTDASMSVPHIAGITDDELMVYAMREAQLILASGARATLRKRSTYYRKFSIVRDVVAATDRLCRGYRLSR